MRSVSRFEAALLHLLYFFMKRAPVQQATQLLDATPARPPCLRRAALELVQDTLAKGCVSLLARTGGWQRKRHLRGEKISEGRLWERTPPSELGLSFSAQSLDFLVWITSAKLHDPKDAWQPLPSAYTVGDLLLFYYVLEALHTTDYVRELVARPPFEDNALCWLGYPEHFATVPTTRGLPFDPWVQGVGACVLEALQPALAERWFAVEAAKSDIRDPQQMRLLGQAQNIALEGFLNAIERAGRLDLAHFLLQAATQLLTPHAGPALWVGHLRVGGLRLADRTQIHRLALIFLHQVSRLQQWARRARTVGYFDEGYSASQLWLGLWEKFSGDVLAERAQAIIRHLDPMRQSEERS